MNPDIVDMINNAVRDIKYDINSRGRPFSELTSIVVYLSKEAAQELRRHHCLNTRMPRGNVIPCYLCPEGVSTMRHRKGQTTPIVVAYTVEVVFP